MKNVIELIKKSIVVLFGLVIFSLGIAFTIQASIGVAPWDCLGLGISYHTPLTYGLAMTCISLIVLCVDLILKESIGLGTIIDALATGNLINLFILFIPASHQLYISISMIIVGLFLAALGQYFYMSAEIGCGPRDALLLGIGKRLKKIKIGFVEILIFVVVLLAGYLLGGPVGIGTLLTTFLMGVVMNIVFGLLHFEPRNLKHQSVIESINTIK